MRDVILDKEHGVVEVSFIGERPWLHYTSKMFSKSIYKELLDDLADILTAFGLEGYKEVFTCIKSDDTKTLKFQTMMGFEPYAVTEDGEAIVFRLPTDLGE